MTASLTYVYCLVRAARAPSLRGVPHGLPGAANPRALGVGSGLWAIVASVPADTYDEAALAAGLRDIDWVGRRAMAHEAVVEHFLTARAVLPMKLFTLFTSDERAAAHVTRNRRRIERILAKIDRQLEWGLRLTLDETAGRAAPGPGTDRSGAAYLARKRDLLGAARVRLTRAQAEAAALFRTLKREATDARRRTATEQAAPGSRLLLDAAFLVPARRTTAFRSTLRRAARTLDASGIVASLTGPWPPYNFLQPPPRAARGRRDARRRAGSGDGTE